jgi:UDP-4-amino-4-deoxy-L-arabinose formyltransferase / UDP-glucuronic acid dehydrogenase (UDP-4-keto-hexauronic acid decarboxylating)
VRALIFGYHRMGCVGLAALLRHGFAVTAVVTHADEAGEEIWWPSLAEAAMARGIAVHVQDDPAVPSVRDLVAAAAPEMIFSFYYRRLIPTAVLALAPRGAFNLHGSLLPRYRGRAPVNWVLVNGETETGVSLHAMAARADSGDLVDQQRVPIDDVDTAFTLYAKLEDAAMVLLDRALPRLAAGTARLTPLDLAQGSYFGRRTPADGRIDWARPARGIYDLVRAVTHPYPGAFTTWRGQALRVWWAVPSRRPAADPPGRVLAIDGDGIVVAAGTGALRLVTVQPPGGPELPACSFASWAGLSVSDGFGLEGDVS